MNSRDSGIYSITSKINGKRYIGSAIRICKRWQNHLSDLKTNRHSNKYLQNHYNKYGENDLVFNVLELVERSELNLQDFKKLLLNKEQTYLDNWKCCEFNCLKTAGSILGYKVKGSKYYRYDSKTDQYVTSYRILGKQVTFGNHYTEEKAIKEVEYLKTLTDDDLLKYKQECLSRPKRRYRNSKNYTFIKKRGRYQVGLYINGKYKFYGYYLTEQEAINRVIEVKLELGL